MTLIVVESPTKARTFNRILKVKNLSKEYYVFATIGHFRDLPSQSIAIDFDKNFQPVYKIIEKKKAMVEKLKELAKTHKKVILATDLDREGESISYHVSYVLGNIKEKWPDFSFKKNGNIDRIIFHEITPTALKEALDNPKTLRVDLVKAQQARRILDRIVGYKLSPLLWKKMNKNWLSAGRVQTVALRLVVEREKEISKFKLEKYVDIMGIFGDKNKLLTKLSSKDNVPYEAKTTIKLFDGEYTYTKTTINPENAAQIKNDLEKDSFIISNIESNEVKRYPPPPFTTSLLQQEAFKKLRFPSKLTMRLAQSLYEKGLITYHRTDSFNLSSQYVFAAKEHINKAYGAKYALEKPRGYRVRSKNAQEAHEAIRPTKADRTLAKVDKTLSAPEKKLYELIYYRALATQMKEAQILESTIQISSKKGYLFQAVHQEILFDGFFRVIAPEYAKKHLTKLSLINNSEINLDSIEVKEKTTQPPYRYSEASLIKAMEEKGIGRPSTYSNTISLIIDKHYVEKDFRYLIPTSLGQSISDYLSSAFPKLFDLAFTAEMEESLDTIANGNESLIDLLKKFNEPFNIELSKVKDDVTQIIVKEDMLDEKCPKCNGNLIARFGKYGKFYACAGYPKCKFIKPNLKYIAGSQCQKCKGRLVVHYSKKGRRFYGCENYPTCKHMQWTLKPV